MSYGIIESGPVTLKAISDINTGLNSMLTLLQSINTSMTTIVETQTALSNNFYTFTQFMNVNGKYGTNQESLADTWLQVYNTYTPLTGHELIVIVPASNTPRVEVTNFPTLQDVSVTNIPAIQDVAVTNFPTSQEVVVNNQVPISLKEVDITGSAWPFLVPVVMQQPKAGTSNVSPVDTIIDGQGRSCLLVDQT